MDGITQDYTLWQIKTRILAEYNFILVMLNDFKDYIKRGININKMWIKLLEYADDTVL